MEAIELIDALVCYPSPPPADKGLLKTYEHAFKWTLEIDTKLKPIWSCSIVLVEIQEKPFAKGSCMAAHMMRDLSAPEEQLVAKFSTRNASRDDYFTNVLLQTFASKWADMYNSFQPPVKVIFYPTFVLELVDRASTTVVCSGEPFIAGDYNANGYVATEPLRHTPQAFSHFTYEHSNQNLIIVGMTFFVGLFTDQATDIQGLNGFYSDPSLHTKTGKGFGNLGKSGMHQFAQTHTCNPVCNYLKLEPLNSSLTRCRLQVVHAEESIRGANIAVVQQVPKERARLWLVASIQGDQVECVAASNVLLCSGSALGAISFWDPVGLRHVGSLADYHSKTVKSLAIRMGTLFSAGGDGELKELDVEYQKVVHTAKSKSDINTICMHGDLIFSGSNDKTVKVWDSKSFQCVATLSSHTRAVKCLHANGNLLFSGANDQLIKAWSLRTNSLVQDLLGHEGWIKALSASQTALFSGSHDETIRVWDLNSLEYISALKTRDRVDALAIMHEALFSVSGDYLETWNSSLTKNTSINARTGLTSITTHGSRVFCGSNRNNLKVFSTE